MSKSVIIYESTKCCSGGACGCNADKSIADFQDALDILRDMDVEVVRYSLMGNPKNFRENPEIVRIMQEQQAKALPITTIDGRVIRVGGYPSIDELKRHLGIIS